MWSRFGFVALLVGALGGCVFDSSGLSVDPPDTACALSHSAIPSASWKDVVVSVKLRPDGTCSGYNNQVGLTLRVSQHDTYSSAGW